MKNNLKAIRENFKMTGSELAKKTNVNSSMIYMIENGKRNPSLELASKISKVLHKSIEEIFFANTRHDTLQKTQKEVAS